MKIIKYYDIISKSTSLSVKRSEAGVMVLVMLVSVSAGN